MKGTSVFAVDISHQASKLRQTATPTHRYQQTFDYTLCGGNLTAFPHQPPNLIFCAPPLHLYQTMKRSQFLNAQLFGDELCVPPDPVVRFYSQLTGLLLYCCRVVFVCRVELLLFPARHYQRKPRRKQTTRTKQTVYPI